MTQKTSNSSEMQKKFIELLTPKSEGEKDNLEALILAAGFLSEISKIIEKKGILLKDVATSLGVSASYVSQVFNGDKLPNFKFLAKLQHLFGVKFEIKAVERTSQNSIAERGESVVGNLYQNLRFNFDIDAHMADLSDAPNKVYFPAGNVPSGASLVGNVQHYIANDVKTFREAIQAKEYEELKKVAA